MKHHPTVITDDLAARLIVERRATITPKRCVLVGISGFDGSGKGYMTAQVADHLQKQGLCVALINVDGWLQLPAKRFGPLAPGRAFSRERISL
jgi:uridine kinase